MGESLKHALVLRYADAMGKSITAVRGTLLAANLISLLLLGSLYNSLFSWGYEQQVRRAELLSWANEVEKIEASEDFDLAKVKAGENAADWIEKIQQDGYNRELAYVKHLTSGAQLRLAAEIELRTLIEREKEQDTFHIPFIETSFSATDRTLIGGLALSLAGIWLFGALARQQAILGEFIEIAKPHNRKSSYSDDEHLFVLKSISMDVSVSTSAVIELTLFAIPAISIFLCALYFLFSTSQMSVSHSWRSIAEASFFGVTIIVWGASAWKSHAVKQLYEFWKLPPKPAQQPLCQCGHPPPPPDSGHNS